VHASPSNGWIITPNGSPEFAIISPLCGKCDVEGRMHLFFIPQAQLKEALQKKSHEGRTSMPRTHDDSAQI
jgi:hypothetical protein